MSNKRQTHSVEHMTQALAALIEENGFAGVTVADIVRRAQVNRGTFYLHFTDKFDMLSKVEQGLLERYTALMVTNTDAPHTGGGIVQDAAILRLLTELQHDGPIVHALLLADGDAHFMHHAELMLGDVLHLDVVASHSQLPTAYARAVALSSVMAIVRTWIRAGFTETPETIRDYINLARNIAPSALVQR